MRNVFKAALVGLVVLLALFPIVSAGPEKTTGIVCPVFSTNSAAGAKNPNAIQIGDLGDYAIEGPIVSVPLGATNDNGAGTADGVHSSPSDAGYTAIFNSEVCSGGGA
ncbi:MAG TPA: hypothetical protein VJG83_04895 [archaeon]|nr:hypothetical protein [archaeon]